MPKHPGPGWGAPVGKLAQWTAGEILPFNAGSNPPASQTALNSLTLPPPALSAHEFQFGREDAGRLPAYPGFAWREAPAAPFQQAQALFRKPATRRRRAVGARARFLGKWSGGPPRLESGMPAGAYNLLLVDTTDG